MSNAESLSPPALLIPSFEVGQKLAGIYMLRKELSKGLWLAHDEVLGKDVSLHFIPPVLPGDEQSMAELRQEIKRSRQLIHPGILRVYDLVEETDWSAISMDWFEGESLAHLLQARPNGFFEPGEVKPWLQQLCQTLDDIHKIQIVHRDVATQNIYVDARGRVLLAKFGISRVIEDSLSRLRAKEANGGGRLASISPQLLDGEAPNKTDDIYSIGATIYELLTGEPPFTAPDLLPQIRKSTPMPMMERRAKLGKRGGTILPIWERGVAAALAKSREERPQTAGELAMKLGLTGRLSIETMAPVESSAAASGTGPVAPVTAAGVQVRVAGLVEKGGGAGLAPAAAIAAVAAGVGDGAEKAKSENAAATRSGERSPADGRPASAPLASPAEQPETPALPAPLQGLAAGRKENRFSRDEDSEPEDETRGLGKHAANSAPYPDFNARTSGVWPAVLIFAALVAVVGGAIYFLSRPDKSDGSAYSKAKNGPATPSETSSAGPADSVQKPATSSTAGTDGDPNSRPAQSSGAANPDASSGEPDLVKGATGETPDVHGPESQAAAAATPGKTGTNATPAPAVVPVETDGDSEKAYGAAVTQKKLADAALAEAEKAVQQKSKANEAVAKTTEPLLAQRAQKTQQMKDADEVAQAVRQAADEKARQAAEAKKALSDWETANGEKLSVREKAAAELEALRSAYAEKQQQAEAAANVVAAADNERKQRGVAVKLAREKAEREKGAVDEEARTGAPLGEQQQTKVDEEIKHLQERLKELQRMRDQPDGASEASASPGNETPAATVAVPSLPPGPQPVRAMEGEFQTNPPPEAPTPEKAIPAPSTPVIATESENSLGMKFVPVGDVFFGIWPVRLRDFETFAKETGYRKRTWRNPGFKQSPDHPVVNVSWNDAMAFCRWLTAREQKRNLLAKGQEYRLPTDVEWSSAVGLPKEEGKTPDERDMSVPEVFPWGSAWPPPTNSGNYAGEETGSDAAIKGYEDGFAWASPVGKFAPNQFGLYDMGGNVWQWCMDNLNGESKAKVLRGASWYEGGLKARLLSSCRLHANPESSTDNYGFRVVRATASGRGSRSGR